MPCGFILSTAGIMIIMYAANKRSPDEWLVWGIAASAILTVSLLILGNAYVHKVKSDLIKKQRARATQSEEEEF